MQECFKEFNTFKAFERNYDCGLLYTQLRHRPRVFAKNCYWKQSALFSVNDNDFLWFYLETGVLFKVMRTTSVNLLKASRKGSMILPERLRGRLHWKFPLVDQSRSFVECLSYTVVANCSQPMFETRAS